MALKPLSQPASSTRLQPKSPAQSAPPPDKAWRLRWLLASPHRLTFFAAGVLFALSALWWTALLCMRSLQIAIPWQLMPATAHALVMTLGFMPLFMAGFLFTAGPRWLNMPEVPAKRMLPQAISTLMGWPICVIGCHISLLLAAMGMALVAAAWLALIVQFMRLWYRSQAHDKAHATGVLWAGGVGAVAMGVITFGLLAGQETIIRAATQVALWMFIATVFAVVSHRMIPFFSATAIASLDAWHPLWLLVCLVSALIMEGVFAAVDLYLYPGAELWRWMQVAIEAPAALLLLWLALRWGLLQSLKIRLLAMLFGGFVWLGIALAMQAISHTLMALSHDQQSLGLAPLHAMTMGYLGATLFAMATRVSCGHSGRSLVADNFAWTFYWILQIAVVLRIASALLPQTGNWLLLAAAATWGLSACAWAVRYGRWFGRPRLDGRAG